MYQSTRRLAAWIACIAMLFATLAPSAARAVAASPSGTWAEICSAAGIMVVQIADDPAGGSGGVTVKGAHGNECVFCTHGLDATGAEQYRLTGGAAGGITRPTLFYQSPSPLAVWACRQSRAPPF
ncbi:DUF2946 domain-containing protein [Massilia sp. PAMC28688]|nr:DUF2946 domain-containing protein [Massilia sp. PAMC28688]